MTLKRNHYGVFKLRLCINKKLQPFFKKKEINKSLKTSNYREAKRLSAIIETKYNEILKVARLLDSSEISRIVNKFIKEELEQDIVDRANLGQGLVKTIVDKDDKLFSTPSLASASMASILRTEYIEDLSNGIYTKVYEVVDEKLQEANISVFKDSEEYKKLCYYMMQAQIALLKEVEQRGRYNIHSNPQVIVDSVLSSISQTTQKHEQPQVKKGLTLSKAIDRYLSIYHRKNIRENKKRECESTLYKVLCILSDVNIKELEDVDLLDLQDTFFSLPRMNVKPYNKMDFKEVLDLDLSEIPENKRLSQRTISDQIDITKQFFRYCFDNGIIDNNIGSQLGVSKPESTKVPFTKDEASEIIEVIKSEEIEKQILLLPYFYTSFRREELYNSMVEEIDGVICFRVTKGKNKFAKRIMPIAKQLLQYYKSKDMKTSSQINEAIEEAKKGISYTALGRYFNTCIKPKVVDDKSKTLHSTRKTFSTLMTQLKVEERMIKTLTGHTPRDTLNKVYVGDVYSVQELKEAVDKIIY